VEGLITRGKSNFTIRWLKDAFLDASKPVERTKSCREFLGD